MCRGSTWKAWPNTARSRLTGSAARAAAASRRSASASVAVTWAPPAAGSRGAAGIASVKPKKAKSTSRARTSSGAASRSRACCSAATAAAARAPSSVTSAVSGTVAPAGARSAAASGRAGRIASREARASSRYSATLSQVAGRSGVRSNVSRSSASAGIVAGAPRHAAYSISCSSWDVAPGCEAALRYSASSGEATSVPSGWRSFRSSTLAGGVDELGAVADEAQVAVQLAQPQLERRLGRGARGRARRRGRGVAEHHDQPVRDRRARPRRGGELQLGRLQLAVRERVHARRGAVRVAAHHVVDALGGERVADRVHRALEARRLGLEPRALGRRRGRRRPVEPHPALREAARELEPVEHADVRQRLHLRHARAVRPAVRGAHGDQRAAQPELRDPELCHLLDGARPRSAPPRAAPARAYTDHRRTSRRNSGTKRSSPWSCRPRSKR